MRFYSLFLVFLIICFSSCKQKNSKDNTSVKSDTLSVNTSKINTQKYKYKYGIKSAIIYFETNVAGNKNKKILYFDDFGNKECEETFENDIITESIFTDGIQNFKIDQKKRTAQLLDSNNKTIAFRFDWFEVSLKQKREGKAIKTENIIIAGKECESYKVDNFGIITKFAGWKNICLFVEQVTSFGKVTVTATKIDENAIINPIKFKIPENIKYSAATNK